MENVVNPCVLIISTHLEESRSVTTKSADFGVDERERHLKVLVLVSGERVGVSTVERVTGILNTPETESTTKITETFKFPIGCCIVILTKCSKEKLTFAGGEIVDCAGCGVGHWCVFFDPFIIPQIASDLKGSCARDLTGTRYKESPENHASGELNCAAVS